MRSFIQAARPHESAVRTESDREYMTLMLKPNQFPTRVSLEDVDDPTTRSRDEPSIRAESYRTDYVLKRELCEVPPRVAVKQAGSVIVNAGSDHVPIRAECHCPDRTLMS